MYLKANGKINITLNIVGKRKDGYHNVDMVMIPIQVHDTIAVSRISKKKENRVCINDHVLPFTDNVCAKVIKLLTEKYNIKKKYEFAIYKEIPMEAGLGGGSSDAAAIFRFYNKKFKLNISDAEAINLLAPLGADIPFFIINKPARVTGIGEIISPIKIKKDYFALIVKPQQGLSTKEMYNEIDKIKLKKYNIDKVITALNDGDDNTLIKEIGNAFEPTAIKKCNRIAEIKEYLIKNGLPITLMSGSGSAVFSLSTDEDKLIEIANKLKSLNYNAFYTKIIKGE